MKFLIWCRSIVASVLTLFSIILFSTLVIGCGMVLRRRDWADFLVHTWGKWNLFFYNITVDVQGEQNIPNEGCLFLFNHSSHFDIIVLAAVMNKPAHFGAKVELFRIPLFGHALRALGSLPIMRTERDRVFKLYDESIRRVHNGEQFFLAAEGTRQPTPGVGEKFKAGPFVFALNGQFPIVPVVIRGAAEILPKKKLLACTQTWASNVKVSFLPPISTKGLTLDDRQTLINQTRNLMTTTYSSL